MANRRTPTPYASSEPVPTWLANAQTTAARSSANLKVARDREKNFEHLHYLCTNATEKLLYHVKVCRLAQDCLRDGGLPERLQAPETYLPTIREHARALEAAVKQLVSEFPDLRMYWDGVNRDELFQTLDPEVWRHRPLSQMRECEADVRDLRKANFDVAVELMTAMLAATRPVELPDAILHDENLRYWADYLLSIVDRLCPTNLTRGQAVLQGEVSGACHEREESPDHSTQNGSQTDSATMITELGPRATPRVLPPTPSASATKIKRRIPQEEADQRVRHI